MSRNATAARVKRLLNRAGLYFSVLVLVSPAVLFFLWMLSLSLKNELDNTAWPPVFIPNPPTFDNFIDVFAKNDFLTYTINSVIVSFSATGLALLLGVPAGYGIAKAKATKAPKPAKAAKEPKGTSKKDQVLALISRKNGASLDEIMTATGWQKHTVRGFIAILGKKGTKIESFKSEAGARTYKAA